MEEEKEEEEVGGRGGGGGGSVSKVGEQQMVATFACTEKRADDFGLCTYGEERPQIEPRNLTF